MISVIVCTYNQEATIARTLDSILCQQCNMPFEIVIGEDCSTDNTRKVCQEYADRYPDVIRLLAHESNKGVVDNYFACLYAAKGEYIADCAGDDEWSDVLKMEKCISVLEGNDDVSVVHTDYVCRDADTGEITPSPYYPLCHVSKGETEIMDGSSLLVPIITQTKRPVIHLCTAIYRKRIILDAINEHPTIFGNKQYGCEDLQIIFYLAVKGKVAYINAPTLYYEIGGATISNTHDEERQFKFVERATQLSFDLANEEKISFQILDDYFSDRVFALLMHAFRAKSTSLREKAVECGKVWKVRDDFKIKCAKIVTSNNILWSLVLAARDLFVCMKR